MHRLKLRGHRDTWKMRYYSRSRVNITEDEHARRATNTNIDYLFESAVKLSAKFGHFKILGDKYEDVSKLAMK